MRESLYAQIIAHVIYHSYYTKGSFTLGMKVLDGIWDQIEKNI